MMKLEEFFELFCEELDDTDLSVLSILTDFKNIDVWDSLTALSIISMIDEEFEILLTGNDMLNSTTIEDLYTLVESKML
jgi:acyl carrier protein